jgi:gluconokinase
MILALDIGTSSARAALFDHRGRRQPGTFHQQTYRLRVTPDGGAELDPRTVHRAVQRVLRATLPRTGVDAVGVAAFWHGLIGVDEHDAPVTPIYTWADSRCRAAAAHLRRQLDERRYHQQTGCMVRACYWPAKLRWLRPVRVARWLSPADWLTGAPTTSFSMASGTGLVESASGRWHELAPVQKLLPVSDEPYPRHGLMWFPAIGDGAAGNLGSGKAAINFGTSAAVRLLSNRAAPFGWFRYRVDARRFLVGGAVSNAGNLRAWSQQVLRAGNAAGDSTGLTVLPFWVSERAPTWPEELRGVIAGLTLATTAADIQRALLDAVYGRLADIAEPLGARRYVVSGGLAQVPAEVQRLANALDREVEVCREPEASLRGAEVFALERLGVRVPPLPAGRVLRPTGDWRAARARQRTLERLLRSEKLTGDG